MKVLVFGANGRTGKLVVERTIAMGHEVSVLLRHSRLSTPNGIKVIIGDALNIEDVLHAAESQDAVIDCIGGTAPWRNQTLERDAMRNIVAAMKNSGSKRLLVVSAMGVSESKKQSPWWYRYLMVPTFLRGSTADKTAMEAIVSGSGLDWVIARPPILTDGDATSKTAVLSQKEVGHTITRADLAIWLVEQLKSEAYIGKAVVMVNK
jgi:putative NADH-flavin reductase